MWMGLWYPGCGDYEYTEGDPEPTTLEEWVMKVGVGLEKLTLGALETSGDGGVASLDPTLLHQGE